MELGYGTEYRVVKRRVELEKQVGGMSAVSGELEGVGLAVLNPSGKLRDYQMVILSEDRD